MEIVSRSSYVYNPFQCLELSLILRNILLSKSELVKRSTGHSKNSRIKFVAANSKMGYNIAQTWGTKLSSIVFAANLSKQSTADAVSYPKSGRNNTLFQGSIHTTKANFCCR